LKLKTQLDVVKYILFAYKNFSARGVQGRKAPNVN